MKKTISITIDKQLLSKIDENRGDIPRSPFINNILKKTIKFQTPDRFLSKKGGGLE